MSVRLFMSLVSDAITMITSSANGVSSFKTRYVIRRKTTCTQQRRAFKVNQSSMRSSHAIGELRHTSCDWKSLVVVKNASVASVAVNVSPCANKYKSLVKRWQHLRVFKGVSLKRRVSCNTVPFSVPWNGV
jgi:hypothetical protein